MLWTDEEVDEGDGRRRGRGRGSGTLGLVFIIFLKYCGPKMERYER